MSRNVTMEEKVIKLVRGSPQPVEPREVVKKIVDAEPSTVRKAIRELVDKGRLQVTLDWKIRTK